MQTPILCSLKILMEWKIVNILCRETGLPISIEHNFKFLVLLPLEASEKIEALKQYYGVTHKGQLVVRGIEIRRHDTPRVIKEFQTELLSVLFDYVDANEVMNKGYEGDIIKYIYTDCQHKNPLSRVAPIDATNGYKSGKLDYDKEKYEEMILDAAETVLGYFGFDRTLYSVGCDIQRMVPISLLV
jgi:DNA polymerase elongation subunit (family B)